MGYMHIDNLYKNQDILLFKECYALEKVHGTSAHVSVKDGRLRFFSGGVSHTEFEALWPDKEALLASFHGRDATVYGEAYGGKCQGMSHTYGSELRFVAFDVKIGDFWLEVPKAEGFTRQVGIPFVPWVRIPTDIKAIDEARDAPSEIARRHGIASAPGGREGVVLRPLVELLKKNGDRIIAKHKSANFRETSSPRKILDPAMMEVLAAADDIASEWVTPMRLDHILGRGIECSEENIGKIIGLMVEDVEREARGEIVASKEARKAIGAATVQLIKSRLYKSLGENP